MDEYIKRLVELVKKGIVGPVKIYGQGKSLPDLSFRKPMKPSLEQRYIDWFWVKVYRFNYWLMQLHHKYNPGYHYWEWVDVMECGCCGFEGIRCRYCFKNVIIGHVGELDTESGDYKEYGY
jgi:hypothetical protein